MRHVLVIANQTAVGEHLTSRIGELRQTDPALEVFVLVPATPGFRPSEVRDPGKVRDPEGQERAQRQLAAALAQFESMEIPADGCIGDPDPMRAARAVMAGGAFDLILVSTLPLGISRWINMDLPHRLQRRFGVAVEHIVAAGADERRGPAPEVSPIHVLLVEDQAVDAELVREALGGLPEDVDLKVARNGAEALEYVRSYGQNAIDVILLDLKMPVMDGHHFLEKVGAEVDLTELDVVVVSTSTAASDRERAHDLGASAYVVKDPDFDRFAESLTSVVAESAGTRAPG